MSEEQQQNIEQAQQPINETQDGTQEQAKPADGTSAEDKKSTNTKSQVFVNSELKGKLGDLKKKKKIDTYDGIVQMLYDSYKKKNNIIDEKIESLDKIKPELINAINYLSSTYPYANNNGVSYMNNPDSLMSKLISVIILEKDNKDLLRTIQMVVKSVNELMKTLNDIDVNSVNSETYNNYYYNYLSEIINNKIVDNNQKKYDYAQQINAIDYWNKMYEGVTNALPKKS